MGSYFKHLHSFLENFKPGMGCISRQVNYSNQWVCNTNGKWTELCKAKFTADATARKESRLDYAGGSQNETFFLKNCGFFSERVPLTHLVRNFDKQIISIYHPTGDIQAAYRLFSEDIASVKNTDEFEQIMKPIRQGYEKIITQAGKSTLEKIWNMNPHSGEKGSILESLKNKGVYINFLEDLGIKYPLIKDYVEMVINAGDVSPACVVSLVRNQGELEISDPDIRLFLAVHYLSLNRKPKKNK